jgi:hypothetical protein
MAVVLGETDGIRDARGERSEERGERNLFNLAGQKVNGDYKGIVIKNGKKVRQ